MEEMDMTRRKSIARLRSRGDGADASVDGQPLHRASRSFSRVRTLSPVPDRSDGLYRTHLLIMTYTRSISVVVTSCIVTMREHCTACETSGCCNGQAAV